MVYKKDQTFSSIANGFMRAMDLKAPVAVIAGELVCIWCLQTRRSFTELLRTASPFAYL